MSMRYLTISGEDLAAYLLVQHKSCFVQWPIGVLLAQARPTMINHHTSYMYDVCCIVCPIVAVEVQELWHHDFQISVGGREIPMPSPPPPLYMKPWACSYEMLCLCVWWLQIIFLLKTTLYFFQANIRFIIVGASLSEQRIAELMSWRSSLG